jgi:tRNA pseudouridine38-40 synthase
MIRVTVATCARNRKYFKNFLFLPGETGRVNSLVRMSSTASIGNNSNSNRSNDNNNKKRPAKAGFTNGGAKKQSKKDKKNHTWKRDFDNDNDGNENSTTPHPGSFANHSMRQQFNVEMDERLLTIASPSGDDRNQPSQQPTSKIQPLDEKDDDNNSKKSKKKVAILLGFLGSRYGGFQVNEGQRTLQAEIELALFRCGMLSASNFGFPFKYGWSNSARTDKGVHAAAQVCSCKIEQDEDEWNNDVDLDKARKRLNDQLPSDIQVLDMERVTRKFCAKTQRDRVRYQYMVPAFLLHPDWNGLLKTNGIDMTVTSKERGDDLKRPIPVDDIRKLQLALAGYRSSETCRLALKNALRKYEGTQYYHNFTRGLSPGQAQGQRYIESFTIQDPVIMDNVEWIPTQVLGQSFLLHQIRKMIGVAVDVARGAVPMDLLERALSKTHGMIIDVAPAQGLFLEMSYFGGYNIRKHQQNKELNDLDWTHNGPANERWSVFRDVVRRHIVEEETKQGNFLQYMYRHELIFQCKKAYDLEK